MTKHSISLILPLSLLLLLLAVAFSAAPVTGLGGGGGKVGGRTKIDHVETNKEVQDLGKYSVQEYNKQQRKIGNGGGGDLKFKKVVAAERQVVSGIKYYLTIAAVRYGGDTATFEAQVVVQPWNKSKQLLHFAPRPATK